MLADTREVLYAENENEQLSMASTTKIMTSLLALESGLWEQQIKVTSDMVAAEGTSIGLLPDDLISVRTLISGMLLESGNDAANVTAYAVAGGQAQFLELMNQKAAEIGMKNTHFDSVSGLDTDSHYSTAYDMALLTAYALENPKFRSICSEKSERVYYGNPPYARTLYNHNRLLSSYEGAIGVKPGFTKQSGYVTYPLWRFDEKFLEEIGGENYKRYSDEWDEMFRSQDEIEDVLDDMSVEEAEELLNVEPVDYRAAVFDSVE